MINGRLRGERGPSDHVGEMAAIEPSQRRSASIVAAEQSVVAKLTEPQLTDLAVRHPEIYRCIARELARRLAQRNAFVKDVRDKIRVFIICSTEALPIARIIQNQFAHDKFLPVIWSDGVFKVTNYTLQDLEDEVDQSDFAIAIAHADDETAFRDTHWPSPRDNVIFELGLFMGRLGRHRAILMEPRDEKLKLPSDLAGIGVLPWVQKVNHLEFARRKAPYSDDGLVLRVDEVGAIPDPYTAVSNYVAHLSSLGLVGRRLDWPLGKGAESLAEALKALQAREKEKQLRAELAALEAKLRSGQWGV